MNRFKRAAAVGLIATFTATGASLAAVGTAQAASAAPASPRATSSSLVSRDTATLTGTRASVAAAGTAQAASAVPVAKPVTSSSLVSPDIATYCNGSYLCMDAPIVSGTNYVITDWTPTYTFVGHFQLQLPNGTSKNSNSRLNHLGRSNGWKFTVPRVHGKYCSTAWADKSKTNHVKLGYVCYQV
jgi:hypothetical protein